jgi:hypothetical protein
VSFRIALLDNVKTTRFSWAELEALITREVISGKRMYVGDASRPNLITWLITLNGASLSTDMAQRVVEIRLADPEYRETWESEVTAFGSSTCCLRPAWPCPTCSQAACTSGSSP